MSLSKEYAWLDSTPLVVALRELTEGNSQQWSKLQYDKFLAAARKTNILVRLTALPCCMYSASLSSLHTASLSASPPPIL